MRKSNRFRNRSQRGAVLIVALVLLLVLTVLGTAGIQDTTMEERMSGNFRDHSAAMQAAETALRGGEIALGSSTGYGGLYFGSMSFNTSGGTYDVTTIGKSKLPTDSTDIDWDSSDVLDVLSGILTDGSDGKYYIEQLPEIELPLSDLTVGFQDQAPRVQYYRVTGRGTGISPNTEVILQSTYFR